MEYYSGSAILVTTNLEKRKQKTHCLSLFVFGADRGSQNFKEKLQKHQLVPMAGLSENQSMHTGA